MKEKAISDIISAVDFKGDYSTKAISEAIKRAIGEKPGIEMVFNADTMLMEDSRTEKRTINATAIKISYTEGVDANNLPIVKTIKFYV